MRPSVSTTAIGAILVYDVIALEWTRQFTAQIAV
jgi:hypothetical protein